MPLRHHRSSSLLIPSKTAHMNPSMFIHLVALPRQIPTNFLPMPSAATPVSAAAEQQYQYNDDKDQFHCESPLMATTQ
jgi:hypothetical protein